MRYTPEARKQLAALGQCKLTYPSEVWGGRQLAGAAKSQAKRLKAVEKAFGQMEKYGPRYSALQTHPFESQKGPGGAKVFVAYAEQGTPAAFRMLWCYGPGPDEITILWVGPHY